MTYLTFLIDQGQYCFMYQTKIIKNVFMGKFKPVNKYKKKNYFV